MNILRSIIVFLWLVATLVPLGLGLVICSYFVSDMRLWWWFVVPWLRGVIGAARIVGGVKYRLHGEENLPAADDMSRVILCPKHQSTWETFYFPSMSSHPLAYVFKKELLRIPVFGWALKALQSIAIDRSAGGAAVKQVLEQGKDRLSRGIWVSIFPEGTRMPPGETKRYGKSGTLLAQSSGHMIVPIAHNAGYHWPRRGMAIKPGVVTFVVGEPVDATGRDPEEVNREIQDWMEKTVARIVADRQ